jgi:hypothetical protein
MMMKKIHVYLMKLSNKTHSDFELSRKTVMNNQSYTIQLGTTQPRQISLGNIQTMSGITDSVGEGRDDRKITKKFNEKNNIVNGQVGMSQHVGDMSATCQNVANFRPKRVSVPTQKLPRH